MTFGGMIRAMNRIWIDVPYHRHYIVQYLTLLEDEFRDFHLVPIQCMHSTTT